MKIASVEFPSFTLMVWADWAGVARVQGIGMEQGQPSSLGKSASDCGVRSARRDQMGVTAVTGNPIQAGLDFIIAGASGPSMCGCSA